jgi:hypothetical protein
LREAPAGRVVNVSSRVGSLAAITILATLEADRTCGSFSNDDGLVPW